MMHLNLHIRAAGLTLSGLRAEQDWCSKHAAEICQNTWEFFLKGEAGK